MARRRGTSRRAPLSEPVAGPDAFRDVAEVNHLRSQAATLLLIGTHLRGDAAALQARAAAGAPVAREEVLPAADLAALGFPSLPAGPPRFRPDTLQAAAGIRLARPPAAMPAPADARAVRRNLGRVAAAFYRDPNAETAAALLELCLRHPHDLVRVSAAASYFEAAAHPQPAIRLLERGLRSRDALTRHVAGSALAHIDPGNPRLAPLLEPRPRRSTRRGSRTSLIVHGTFARTASWWQPPSGDFWKYLHDTVDPSLYGAQDRFEWSGGYSDAARALAGSDLATWVQQHNLQGLNLFTHSHGGSVAMLATHAGTQVGRMVLLSCPVHWPKYTPDFNVVGSVVSVRVHLDLVILADRGGQWFSDNRIRENVLPIWFDHFATHDPGTWQTYNVPAML